MIKMLAASLRASSRPQLVFLFALCSVLTHALGQIQPINAAGTSGGSSSSSASETTSSSQPLWSYQVKPNSYGGINSPNGPLVGQSAGHGGGGYGSGVPMPHQLPSIFDTFNGFSQRQGALTSSPFLSILPIILIAAGGMLLLLPMLTMMMASPFGGGGAFGAGGGGYNQGPFGFPQVSKKRSLDGQKLGLIEILENVSTTIEELSKKYNPAPNSMSNSNSNTNGNKQTAGSGQKRSKSLLGEMELSSSPSNHKPAATGSNMMTLMEEHTSTSTSTTATGNNNNINSISNGLS